MGEHPTHPCPACKQAADRKWEGFGFGFARKDGRQGNSGVTKHDYPTADEAIGHDANQKWADYDARGKIKKKVREQAGSEPLIRRDGPGYTDYQAMTGQEVDARKKFVKKVNPLLKEQPEKTVDDLKRDAR